MYLLARSSGLRASELASLPPEAFQLDGQPATVVVPAAYTKNKKLANQPLPVDVAEMLGRFLEGKPKGKPVWPGTWHEKAAKMLRIDLKEAAVEYIVDGPDGPLYADFHSLRHSYIAMLDHAGLTLKQAMQLARHSSPELTMVRYGRLALNDLGRALEEFLI